MKRPFINDVTQIWTFSDPPLSHKNGYFTYNLIPSVTNVLIPFPPTLRDVIYECPLSSCLIIEPVVEHPIFEGRNAGLLRRVGKVSVEPGRPEQKSRNLNLLKLIKMD